MTSLGALMGMSVTLYAGVLRPVLETGGTLVGNARDTRAESDFRHAKPVRLLQGVRETVGSILSVLFALTDFYF